MHIIEETIQIIAKEMTEAHANQWTITKIVKELSDMNTTSEKKLRERALTLLQELDPEAASIYERFSTMKVYNSNATIAGFNRGNIIKSLLKETTLARGIAEKITLEVENQIKDSKITFLTAGLIRELVNAKLISYGYEEVRHHYARYGEPAYDIQKKIQEAPYVNESTKEFNLALTIPQKARELHYDGSILIEDTSGFATRPYAYAFIAEQKETAEKTILAHVHTLVSKRNYFCLAPNSYGLTHAVSGTIKNESAAKKAGELILDSFAIAGNDFCTSIELFTPEKLAGMTSDKLLAAKVGETIIGKRESVVGVDSKYSLKLIHPEGKKFIILNNSEEEYFPLNSNLFSPTQGIDLFVNINLEKIAQDSDADTFFTTLASIENDVQKLILAKKELLLSRSYLKEFNPNEMKTGIGVTNLFSVAQTLGEEKKIDFANKTYKEMAKAFDTALIFGCTAGAREHFSRVCGKEVKTQNILAFEECLNSKKSCFTGNATNPQELEELITKKVKQIEYLG